MNQHIAEMKVSNLQRETAAQTPASDEKRKPSVILIIELFLLPGSS